MGKPGRRRNAHRTQAPRGARSGTKTLAAGRSTNVCEFNLRCWLKGSQWECKEMAGRYAHTATAPVTPLVPPPENPRYFPASGPRAPDRGREDNRRLERAPPSNARGLRRLASPPIVWPSRPLAWPTPRRSAPSAKTPSPAAAWHPACHPTP
jgi:hypothetical protein